MDGMWIITLCKIAIWVGLFALSGVFWTILTSLIIWIAIKKL